MLFIGKARIRSSLWFTFAFCDADEVIACTCGFYIKKIGSFACTYLLCIDLHMMHFFFFFHGVFIYFIVVSNTRTLYVLCLLDNVYLLLRA